MADPEKLVMPWSNDELDVIVADYFEMLAAELAGRSYVKKHRNAVLMDRIGRSHGSIEFKHQNISAVLEELGMPWIAGYKPMRNYQGAILSAIDRYLSARPGVMEPPARLIGPETSATELFVAPPAFAGFAEPPAPLKRLIRKFDPAERDRRNRALGRAGEEFVLDVERRRLVKADRPDLAAGVRWISEDEGDGAGYDILSFDLSGEERQIEVKTTNGAARTPFFLSRTEHETAAERTASWRLYRVHLFAQAPRIFTVAPPLERSLQLATETWRASIRPM